MGNENAGGKDNYILILDFPYPLIFVMDRKLAFWLFSKTMLMLLFSFSFISSLILIISFFLLTLGFVAVVVLLLLYPAAVDVVKVKVAQLCPALCDPMDYTVHGILQARILE